MRKARILLSASVILLAALGIARLRADQAKEAAAGKAAEAWLRLVDQHEYGKSWEEAGAFFKGAVARGQWEKQISSVRVPLGALQSRKQATASYTKQLPGAPDGEYVVIQYQTSFENKTGAIETVTPMLEKDGQWRVVGYFVR